MRTLIKEAELDRAALKSAIQEGRVEWRRHTLERMMERGLARHEVLATLLMGEQIEDYPERFPFPCALFMHSIGDRPLHVVAAFDHTSQWVFIMTAYRPDLEHFDRDFKTRKRS